MDELKEQFNNQQNILEDNQKTIAELYEKNL